MFRRKQPQPPLTPADIGPLLVDAATDLYRSAVDSGGAAELHARLAFDEQQRVAAIEDLTVDGRPVMPALDVFEQINTRTTRIAALPQVHHIAAISVAVVGGKISTSITYRENPSSGG